MASNAEIERIRERIDMVDLVNGYVPLKKTGRSYKACCPFHQEKTPSFHVFPDTQSFHCFGCGQGGDAFTFLMKVDSLDFGGALERLAQRVGVELTRRVSGGPQLDSHRQRLFEATATAAAFFAHILGQSAAGAAGRALLAQRGISETSVERFGLGFAPESWDALLQHLRGREISDETALEAGLLTRHDDTGSLYDRFRNRLIFPIRDREGRVLGFGGRALGTAQPKYLNSPQSQIFDKGATLYGIDLAATAIRRADQVVLVEGYVDALMAHQMGYENVVATMGTALTEPQIRLLKPLTRRLVLALDADTAGQLATLRGIEQLRQSLTDDVAPVAQVRDARVYVKFERRLNAEIRVLTLPTGDDPDSLLRRDAASWPGLVDGAEPLLDYLLRAALAGVDQANPRTKSAALEQIAPALREVGDPIIQAHYISLLSRQLGIESRIIERLILARRSEASASDPAATPETLSATRSPQAVEDYLLSLLLHYPAVAAEMAEQIRGEDFTDARNRLIWEAIQPRLAHNLDGVPLVRSELDETIREHWGAIMGRQQSVPELLAGRAREAVTRALRTVRERRERQLRDTLLNLIAAPAEDSGSADQETVRQQLAVLTDGVRLKAYYPPRSPYFKDIRDRA